MANEIAVKDKLFHTAHARVERASLKARELAQMWNNIAAEHLYKITPKVNRHGIGELRAIRMSPIPPEFALQLGEILYQLRAALDSCVYDAAILKSGNNPPPYHRQLEFSVCAKATDFEGQCKRRFKPLSQAVIDVIESVQPYQTQPVVLDVNENGVNLNNVFGALNEWASKDRHRTLHTVSSRTVQIKPRFKLPDRVRVNRIKVFDLPVMGENELIATFSLSGWSQGMKAAVNPDLAIQISLDEAALPGVGTSLVADLSLLGLGVIGIIQMMEAAARG